MRIQTDNFGYNDAFRCRFHENRYDYPAHIHQFAELVVVLEGEIVININGHEEIARAGDMALIEPFAVHGFQTPQSCKVWIAVFSNTLLSDFSAELTRESARAVFTPTKSLFAYIADHLVEPPDGRSVRETRVALCAIFEEYKRLVPSKTESEHKHVVSAIFLYMNAHFREELTLCSLANALGYSPGYISHALSTIPNMNFNSILASLRVEYAKNLLLTCDWPVLDIALESGFSNERSFHRSFQKLVGTSPLVYKRTQKRGVHKQP